MIYLTYFYLNFLFLFSSICNIYGKGEMGTLEILMLISMENVNILTFKNIYTLEFIMIIFLFILYNFFIDLSIETLIYSLMHMLMESITKNKKYSFMHSMLVPLFFSEAKKSNSEFLDYSKYGKFWYWFDCLFLISLILYFFIFPFFFPNYFPGLTGFNLWKKMVMLISTASMMAVATTIPKIVSEDNTILNLVFDFICNHPILSFISFSIILISGSYLFYKGFNIILSWLKGDTDPKPGSADSTDLLLNLPSPPKESPSLSLQDQILQSRLNKLKELPIKKKKPAIYSLTQNEGDMVASSSSSMPTTVISSMPNLESVSDSSTQISEVDLPTPSSSISSLVVKSTFNHILNHFT